MPLRHIPWPQPFASNILLDRARRIAAGRDRTRGLVDQERQRGCSAPRRRRRTGRQGARGTWRSRPSHARRTPATSTSCFAPASARRNAGTDSGCRAGRARPPGWYCTENTGLSFSAMPQFEPSNSETCVCSTFFGSVSLVHREAVVHRGDLDLAGGEVLHRMVRAVMALMHLHGLAAEREAEHLVAEADAEGRRAAVDQLLDHRHRVFAGRRRIARAVRQEHAVRLQRQDVFGRGRRRHHRHLAAGRGEQAQDVALDAVVDGDDMEFAVLLPAVAFAQRPRRLVPGEALRGSSPSAPGPCRRGRAIRALPSSARRDRTCRRAHARSRRSACPCSRISAVSARVSMPGEADDAARACSHASRCGCAR